MTDLSAEEMQSRIVRALNATARRFATASVVNKAAANGKRKASKRAGAAKAAARPKVRSRV